MDINNLLSGGPAPTPSKSGAPPLPPQPQQQQHPSHYQQQQQPLPSTPIQTGPSQSFRDYGQQQPPLQSPTSSRGPSMDYGAHQMAQGPYASPQQTYQQNQGPYPSRAGPPPPPPLQPMASPHDLRPPSGPYGRPTPTSSISTTSGGYPFPTPGPGQGPHQQASTSPAQRHHPYPPPSGYAGRESYGSQGQQQLPGPGPGLGHGHGSGAQYLHGSPGAPLPQTPPVGTPGAAHPYLQQQHQQQQQTQQQQQQLHQRAGSNFAATTPTSVHSQQSQQHQHQSQYGHPPPPFGSPASQSRQGLPPARQQSQPPTPLGPPPLSTMRQSSNPRENNNNNNSSYPPPQSIQQPSSPFQQRISTSSNQSVSYPHPSGYPPSGSSVTQLSPRQHISQISPASTILPSLPLSIPRVPSNHSIYDNPAPSSDPSRRSQSHISHISQSERDRSLSVSPKTRLPSLPGPTPMAATSAMGPDRERVERAVTPAKRKLETRDLPIEELEKQTVRPPPFETQEQNGHPVKQESREQTLQPSSVSAVSASPAMARKARRIRHRTPPVWAMQYKEGVNLKNRNFILFKPKHNYVPHVNGKAGGKAGPIVKTEHASRQTSPDEKRSMAPSQTPTAGAQAPMPPSMPPPTMQIPNANMPLGPWETCISSVKPLGEMAKAVADFLFLTVVNNPHKGEIMKLGIPFEIEAKLGTLIDKSNNSRVNLPIVTECVLADRDQWGFRSEMSFPQHKAFNEYLNECTKSALQARGKRVPIDYEHRRETDKFYELPDAERKQLPGCMQTFFDRNGRRSVKVRASYSQKTDELLATIIKARVADLHLYFPACPFDCRISVNLEMPWDGDLDELVRYNAGQERQPDRKKDRLSYKQSCYTVDLTQVKHNVPGPNGTFKEQTEHEIEIEVSADKVLEQGHWAMEGKPHQYTELVEGLIDNVRNLTRFAAGPQ